MSDQETKIEEVMRDDIELEDDTVINNDSDSLEISLIENEDEFFGLSSGQALDIQETYKITAKEDTKLIVLVGPFSSGKTTIIASVYQMFLRSPVNEFYFAGSKTLLGFEQRSYFSRFTTNQQEPMTGRTSSGVSNIFLHLRLWDSKKNTYINLLFADVSGEDYERYIGNVDAARENLAFIKYADYITSILDGELIIDKSCRNGLVNGMSQLLQTLVDANLTSEITKLQILLSKYDVIDNPKNQDVDRFIEYNKQKYQEKFESQFSRFEFFDIAAMPKNGDKYKFGSGILDLILSWAKQDNVNRKIDQKHFSVNNEFNKLYFKLIGE